MVTETRKRTMEEFAETVRDVIEALLGEGFQVEIHNSVKNNDTHLTGLIIRNAGSNIAPNIYLEYYFDKYQEGMTMEEIIGRIIRAYKECHVPEHIDISAVLDFESVKDRICYKLVNADWNKERLSDIPYMAFHDLALIPYIVVSNDKNGISSVTINDDMLERWNIDKEVLFDLAKQNTRRLFRDKIDTMINIIGDIMSANSGEFEEDYLNEMEATGEMPGMYVCTNETKTNGAGVILYDGLLRDFSDTINDSFYILPSSIHETIFVPDSENLDAGYLKFLVNEINQTVVQSDEVLSNNVYYYNRSEDCVEMM